MGLEAGCRSSFPRPLLCQERQDLLCQGSSAYSLLSEELGLLSLVRLRQNLPDTSVGIFNTGESEWTTSFFCSSFLALASPRAWTDWNTIFVPVPLTLPAPRPAFHHPRMNGFCNSSCCVLWTCYLCFSVKHMYWMWERKEYLTCSQPFPS